LCLAVVLLAEQNYVALLGSETGKLVAAVGQSGLAKGVKAGSIIRAAANALGGDGQSSHRAEGRMRAEWTGKQIIENIPYPQRTF
jgi:hypothetical protein